MGLVALFTSDYAVTTFFAWAEVFRCCDASVIPERDSLLSPPRRPSATQSVSLTKNPAQAHHRSKAEVEKLD
jgi:hypothetical protein